MQCKFISVKRLLAPRLGLVSPSLLTLSRFCFQSPWTLSFHKRMLVPRRVMKVHQSSLDSVKTHYSTEVSEESPQSSSNDEGCCGHVGKTEHSSSNVSKAESTEPKSGPAKRKLSQVDGETSETEKKAFKSKHPEIIYEKNNGASSKLDESRRQTHRSKFKLEEVFGDLFSCESSLAHCVSTDFKMGAGIAKIFNSKFGRVKQLLDQNKDVGEVAILKDGERFIYYLVTKEYYYNKPDVRDVRLSLKAMCNHARKHGVNKIGMPLIGCGLDKLKWYDVKRVIVDVFQSTDIHITVYKLKADRGGSRKR